MTNHNAHIGIIMKRIIAVLLFALALPAFCPTITFGKWTDADTVQPETCFIYTDGLLDDLCAIEYLAQRYDNAVIMLQDPEGLKDNTYASPEVTGVSTFVETVSPWFKSIALYTDSVDISQTDFYLLAPLTEYAELLKANPSFKSKRALIMAGDSDGPDGAGEDWNAIQDIDAYRYVTENMTELVQMTRPDCEAEYEANGYPFEAMFLDEYTNRMSAMDENVCCYDLQAVSLYFQEDLYIPDDSILRFREKSIIGFFTAPPAAKLINDMNDGKIPKECNLSFASMIGQPKVSVTDPEVITDLYNRLSRLVVVQKSNRDMTDAYFHISFVLQDDTEIKWDFHGPSLWYNNKQTYEVNDEGDLWPKVRELLDMI